MTISPSQRELSVIEQLVLGASNDEIAARLGISPKTVEFHLSRLYARCDVSGRTALAVHAVKRGWVAVVRLDDNL